MNKKQLIVSWSVGIIIVLILLLTPGTKETKMIFIGRNMVPTISEEKAWSDILTRSLAVIVIGGLLMYTLKDKK